MTAPNDYIPIDCDLHDRYEVAILHRVKLRVHWRDAGGQDHVETLLPTDLLTREGAEYLEGTNELHETKCVRLDRIHRVERRDGGAF